MGKKIFFLLYSLALCGLYYNTEAQTLLNQVFSKYNYYTSEKNATIVSVLSDSSDQHNFSLALFNDKNEKIKSADFVSNTLKVNIPISYLSLGTTKLFVHILYNNDIVQKDTLEIVRLKPTANEVKIDLETGGIIVNNLPYFPFGFYCGPVNDLPEQEVVRGFNLIGPYQGNLPEGVAERKAYMDRCAQLGIKVQYGVNSLIGSGHNGAKGLDKTEEEKFEILKNEILAFRDHPALLSWYINDEPDGQGRPPELLERAYNFIHELDPYHPVSIVFMMPSKVNAFRNTMDIAMTDPYPIPKSVDAVQDYVVHLQQLFQHEKSVWLVPQAFGGQEMWPREPTAKEIRAMTYLGLIHGVKGIQYFIRSKSNLKPQSVSAWSECSKMAVEIADMSPFLLSDEKSGMLKTNDPEILARYFSYKGEKLVIVVNKSNIPKPFVVYLEEDKTYESTIEAWFENRKLSNSENQIKDIIDGLSTRVYLYPYY